MYNPFYKIVWFQLYHSRFGLTPITVIFYFLLYKRGTVYKTPWESTSFYLLPVVINSPTYPFKNHFFRNPPTLPFHNKFIFFWRKHNSFSNMEKKVTFYIFCIGVFVGHYYRFQLE